MNIISALSDEDLATLGRDLQLPGFQAKSIKDFVWQKNVESFADMTSLPLATREALAHDYSLYSLDFVSLHKSADGTQKFLYRTYDQQLIEAVVIPSEKGGLTACISTQVGCAMGCCFCASTKAGVIRNLQWYEISDQVLLMQSSLQKPAKIDRVVVMGIGEPFNNFDHLVIALQRLNHTDYFGLGARRFTVSTVGLPFGIRKFAELPQQFNLAISLHAANDTLRTQLIPTNDKIGIDAILAAADEFFKITGREYTIEYILLRDLNDQVVCAQELGRLLAGRRCTVNLIPANAIESEDFQAPSAEVVQAFAKILNDNFDIPTMVRKSRGDDIAAACGQLRLNNLS